MATLYLPTILGKQEINYPELEKLCSIGGLGHRLQDSTDEAHEEFMKNYSRILKAEEKLPKVKFGPQNRIKSSQNGVEIGTSLMLCDKKNHHQTHLCNDRELSVINHNISDHLRLLHKPRPTLNCVQNFQTLSLKKLLRKLPFERTRIEKDAIYQHLQRFTHLKSKIPLKILRELSAVIQLEKWDGPNYTVFCGRDLFLILKGSVRMNHEIIKPDNENMIDSSTLKAGRCFGNITASDSDEMNAMNEKSDNGAFTATTLERCELVKISSQDYHKMKQLVDSRIRKQNLDVIRSCRLFENCSKLALGKIAQLLRWKSFLPDTVLAIEGDSCPFIGLISKGSCYLRKAVNVCKSNGNRTIDRRQKQLTIGYLGVGDSFGECSVVHKLPISYTVVTSSHVNLAVISLHDYNDVDEVTKGLLLQCYDAKKRMFETKTLTDVNIEEEYIRQQKQREWAKFKNDVVEKVIFHRYITPGYGKWGRNPTPKDVMN
ncbi:cyclic nucleotide-binding domain-containing protein 1-like isoform X2 [Xenia sp. Carnegie-2017]|nr:cyclic nucleotide-binding domain-containing protein 1-like isoform X2 [Xenia sp. Carnegie-2017]